jgi:uncharacterized protein
MLKVALTEVRSGAVETVGEIAAADPLLKAAGCTVLEPLAVRGRFSAAGEGKYFWRATGRTLVLEECRRCLEPVEVPVALDLSVIFATGDEVPEGDGVYHVAARTQLLDLAPVLREEFLLGLPQYVECRSDCKGLCVRCGANLNDGPCGCRGDTDPRWNALKALTQSKKD